MCPGWGTCWVRPVVLVEWGNCCAQHTGPQPCWESFRIKVTSISPGEASNTVDQSVPRGLWGGSLLTLQGLWKRKKPLFWPPRKLCILRSFSNHPQPSNHPFIYLTHLSIYLSTHKHNHSFIHLPTPSGNLAIHPSIWPLSTHPPKHPFTHPLTHPSIHWHEQISTHLAVYPPSCLFTHPCIHPTALLVASFTLKTLTGHLQLARPCLVGANVKDTCPTLGEFPMEAVSITHNQRLSAALLWPSDQAATLGSPPGLGWEDVWGQGKHTSWGWKHLGVSSDIRTGKKALSWDLDSIPLDLLGGGWSSGWMGV